MKKTMKKLLCAVLAAATLGTCSTGVYSGGDAPHIGSNGNWFVGSNDTGVSATGPQGENGAAGPSGVGIESIGVTKSADDNGYNYVTFYLTNGQSQEMSVKNGSKGLKGDTGAQGPKGDTGPAGPAGKDGVGIVNINIAEV